MRVEEACFIAGTHVLILPPAASTAESMHRSVTRNIKDLQDGEFIVANCEKTGAVTPAKILQSFRRVSRHLRVLTLSPLHKSTKSTLFTTDEHPFWVEGRGWTKASQ